MNKDTFLKELEELLSDLPEEERKEALAYYRSYFEDAGEENLEKVLKELESPAHISGIIHGSVSGEKARDIQKAPAETTAPSRRKKALTVLGILAALLLLSAAALFIYKQSKAPDALPSSPVMDEQGPAGSGELAAPEEAPEQEAPGSKDPKAKGPGAEGPTADKPKPEGPAKGPALIPEGERPKPEPKADSKAEPREKPEPKAEPKEKPDKVPAAEKPAAGPEGTAAAVKGPGEERPEPKEGPKADAEKPAPAPKPGPKATVL